MLSPCRTITARSGASGSTISMKSSAPGPLSPRMRRVRLPPAKKTLSASPISPAREPSSPTMPRPGCFLRSWTRIDDHRRLWRQHHAAAAIPLDGDGLDLRRGQQVRAQHLRHLAARQRLGGKRRQPRRRQPVVQPVDAVVGDRRHEDQHFRQHHERRRQHQQLERQAEAQPLQPQPRQRGRFAGDQWAAQRNPWPPGSRTRPCRCDGHAVGLWPINCIARHVRLSFHPGTHRPRGASL